MKFTRNELIEKMGLEKVEMLERYLSGETKDEERIWSEFVALCVGMDDDNFADTIREFEVEDRQKVEEKIRDCIG